MEYSRNFHMVSISLNRNFQSCDHHRNAPLHQITSTCKCCQRMFVFCEQCSREYMPPRNARGAAGKPPYLALFCHRLIFTSGVCAEEGTTRAASGIAIVSTARRDGAQSVPILPNIEPGRNRTQARAELLAVCYGMNEIRKTIRQSHGQKTAAKRCIIVTDSHYVVTAMTQWVPHWRVSSSLYREGEFADMPQGMGWRINPAQPVDNLDLFQRLGTAYSNSNRRHIS